MNPLTDLNAFIESSESELNRILEAVGWTEAGLRRQQDSSDLVQCRHDSSHKVSACKLEDHECRCGMQRAGYSRQDITEGVSSSAFYYDNAPTVHSIRMNVQLQNDILRQAASNNSQGGHPLLHKEIPLTFERAQTTLTATERLALYDYCVKTAKDSKKLVHMSEDELMFLNNGSEKKNEEEGQQKSYLEVLAEERDYKRRRQSYRAKNVHTTKKSQTEIMREVINNQMEILEKRCKDNTAMAVKVKQEKVEDQRLADSTCEETSEIGNMGSTRSSPRSERALRSSRERSPKHKKKKKHRSRSRSRDKDRRHKKHKKHGYSHKD